MTTETFVRTLMPDPDQPGELMIELGEEVCAQLGWQVGDQLEWLDNEDGTWTLKKIPTP